MGARALPGIFLGLLGFAHFLADFAVAIQAQDLCEDLRIHADWTNGYTTGLISRDSGG